MTVSPSEKQDGNRSPDHRPSPDRNDAAAVPALPPMLFQLPDVSPESRPARTSDDSRAANPHPENPYPDSVASEDARAATEAEEASAEAPAPRAEDQLRPYASGISKTEIEASEIRVLAGPVSESVPVEPPANAEKRPQVDAIGQSDHPVRTENPLRTEKPVRPENPVRPEKPVQTSRPAHPSPAPMSDGATPAGRGWVERIGSQTLVVALLLGVAGAAMLAGRGSEQAEMAGPHQPSHAPEHSISPGASPAVTSNASAPATQLSLTQPQNGPSQSQSGPSQSQPAPSASAGSRIALSRVTGSPAGPSRQPDAARQPPQAPLASPGDDSPHVLASQPLSGATPQPAVEKSATAPSAAANADSSANRADLDAMELGSPGATSPMTETWPAATSTAPDSSAVTVEPTLNPAASITADRTPANTTGGAEQDTIDSASEQGSFIVEPSVPATSSQLSSEQGPALTARAASASGSETATRTPQGYRTSATPNGNIDWLAYLPSRERVAQAAVPGAHNSAATHAGATETPTNPVASYEDYLRQHAEGYAARTSQPPAQPSYTVPGSTLQTPIPGLQSSTPGLQSSTPGLQSSTPGMFPQAGASSGVPSGPYTASPAGPSTY